VKLESAVDGVKGRPLFAIRAIGGDGGDGGDGEDGLHDLVGCLFGYTSWLPKLSAGILRVRFLSPIRYQKKGKLRMILLSAKVFRIVVIVGEGERRDSGLRLFLYG
jgi:hypothetical protein